jgi:hypothetical protein
MPFKLKNVSSKEGQRLWNVFNQKVAEKHGIVFKNRVPAVEMFPELFDRIDLAEYNRILNNHYFKTEIISAHSIMKRK